MKINLELNSTKLFLSERKPTFRSDSFELIIIKYFLDCIFNEFALRDIFL